MIFLLFDKAWTNSFGPRPRRRRSCSSLGLLPPARGALALAVTLVATMSSATATAVERGNIDLLMFVMVATGAVLWTGGFARRVAGYALFLAAGLLKLYPLVLLALLLRERIGRCIALGVLAAAVLAAFLLAYHDELVRMRHNIPSGWFFTAGFGAVNLPNEVGLHALHVAERAGTLPAAEARRFTYLVPLILLLLLTLEASTRAAVLARRADLRGGFAALPARHAALLVAGALVLCGCFFAGQSVLYRGIFLLLPLPGLLHLSRSIASRAGRTGAMSCCAIIVFLMWWPSIQWGVTALGLGDTRPGHGTALGYAAWAVNGVAWWWLIGVLLAVLLRLVQDCDAAGWLGGLIARARSRRRALTAGSPQACRNPTRFSSSTAQVSRPP